MSSTKLPILTKSTIRISAWISGVIIVLYLLFNFFTVLILDHQLEERLDHHLTHEIEHFMNAFYFEGDSFIMINPAEFRESDLVEITENPFFLQIYSESGKLYFRSENLNSHSPIPLESVDLSDDEYHLKNLMTGGEVLRCGYKKIVNTEGRPTAILQLSIHKATALAVSTNILLFNLITFPLILIFIVFISIFIARKSYQPINRIIEISRKISTSNLKERLHFKADPADEIGRLRDTLNDLFDRLEHQIGQITQFTDNASHQLMTPLTVMKTELEFIQKKCTREGCKDSLIILDEQTQRMTHIIKTLLILAKDCKDCTDTRTVFNLKRLVEDDIKQLFKEYNINYTIESEVLLRGNKDYFSMVIQNLINNAIKYSPADSKILFRVISKNSHTKIFVEDFGIGLSDKDRDRIFERFYRGAAAENSDIPGYGLGLSLVSSIVRSMGGTVDVEKNKPQGTIFIITVPELRTD